jgi:hypothetical protein
MFFFGFCTVRADFKAKDWGVGAIGEGHPKDPERDEGD